MRSVLLAETPRRSPRGASQGTTLLELIAYLAVLTIVISLAANTFVSNTRLSIVGQAAVEQLHTLNRIRHDFTETVHVAEAVVEGVGDYKTGADCLVLRVPPRPDRGETQRFTVFGRLGDGRFFRQDVAKDTEDILRAAGLTTYPKEMAAATFTCDSLGFGEIRLVTLDLTAQGKPKGLSRVPARITAALRYYEGGPRR